MGSALRVPNPNQWASTVEEISVLHREFEASLRTAIEKGIEIGQILTKVKGALHHGEWLPWLDDFAPFSQRMAYYYVAAYDQRDQIHSKLATGCNFTFKELSGANGDVQLQTQQLHESNFYFHSIRATQRLMGEINHEIKDHPVDSWERDKCQSLAAALEPLAELYQRLKAMIA